MAQLCELSYQELVRRLRELGFPFYRQGKVFHELSVRGADDRAVSVPRYKGKKIRKGTVRAVIREVGLSVEEFMGL